MSAQAEAEADRLEALRALQILDTAPEERFDRVIRLAQRLFDVPMVAISLIDENRQWHKANLGLDVREGARVDAFCDRTIEQPGPFVVADASADSRYRANPWVTEEYAVRFYAGQPLAAPGGHRVGALCILDNKPRTMTDLELDLLRDLADWVQKELLLDQEMVRASEVQRRLLPRARPDLAGYEFAAQCVAARGVGGDFYDWYPIGDQCQIVLADVMGKGVAAAIIAASVRAVLRGASRYNALEAALNRAAASLEDDLSETDTFVTLFCARLSADGELDYVDAGHGLSAIIRSDGEITPLMSDGGPFGALFGTELHAHRERLHPGDTLMSVSDGFLDAFDSAASAAEAVTVAHRRSADLQGLIDELTALHAERAGGLDDLTLVAVRRLPVNEATRTGAVRPDDASP